MLQVKNLSKGFGAQSVLEHVSFILNDGERVALVGPNGSGKSTLLRCVVGEEHPDEGEIILSPPGATVGYLPQALTEMDDVSVREALERAQQELVDAERALQAAAEALATGDPGDDALAAYDAALERFEALGGYEREYRATAVLTGLGLTAEHMDLPVSALSGGQKTRLGLAMLLLRDPDLLILDEPTNHLDMDALTWLEGFIQGVHGAVLLVSHDREFLDRTVERVLYLDPKTRSVQSYPGNYSAFAAARAHEAERQREAWVHQEKYVNQVQADIARLKGHALAIERSTTPRQPGIRRLARKQAALAKSREKKLERYLSSDERVEKPRPEWNLKLDFGPPPPGGRAVLRLEDVSFAYPDGPDLLDGITLDVQYGERIAIIGPNGSGKSTLLKLIAGQLVPVRGCVHLGANVRLGLLAQEQETLDPDRTVLETALHERPMSETEARSFLHFFLFSGDDVFRRVGQCSFGERTRLQLALLVLRGCNLLLLDEPLNHLDIEGREHFAAALESFEGTVIAVVHDRAFLRRFSERVVDLTGGRARVFHGGYEGYEEAMKPASAGSH